MPPKLLAGAAAADITPADVQFLFGYPHVARYSTGVHDRLLSSALFLHDGRTSLLLVANDVIYVSKATACRVRERIERETGIPAANIMVTATHTHSGPMTVDVLSSEADPAAPKTDPRYVAYLEDRMVEAAGKAGGHARPAEIGLARADGSCVGGNRHDPRGPSDPEAPVLVVRDLSSHAFLAVMPVCSMHPTVLHEDSTLVSGDFPAMTRQYLQQRVLGGQCPVVYHTGPCGNQSPRHVARANTFGEAQRLGHLLGQSIAEAIRSIDYVSHVGLGCCRELIDLPLREIPSVREAEADLRRAWGRLESVRRAGAPRGQIRTAECDWFGAEETVTLARAGAEGRLEATIASVLPAEVQLIQVGPWSFVGWPGETYVEFALAVKSRDKNCCLVGLANGELQGYLVTEEAVRQRHYEGMNATLASPEAGNRLVSTTLRLLAVHPSP